jgi:hypothetical protein
LFTIHISRVARSKREELSKQPHFPHCLLEGASGERIPKFSFSRSNLKIEIEESAVELEIKED